MDREILGRREVLALVAATGGVGAANAVGDYMRDSTDEQKPEKPPDESESANAEQGTETPKPDPEVRLEDHGGVVDGTTDDTDALLSALNEAAPDGTVRLPEGDILIGSRADDAIHLVHRHRGVTIAGSGPGLTRLKMASGHNAVHRGIVVTPSQKDEITGITIRDLTLDGQGLTQNYNIANGITVLSGDGTGYPLTIENCVIRDWATNGCQLREPGTRIFDSSIVMNGRKQEEMTGKDGHGVAAFIGDNPNGRTLIQRCLLQGNTGAGADNKGGNMTIRDSVIDDCGYGVKQNSTTNIQIISNTRISNLRTEPGVYTIPQDSEGGDLILNDVCIENATDPALLFPSGGSVTGTHIHLRHTNTESSQPASVVIKDEGRSLDIGQLVIYEVEQGDAMFLKECTGSIEQLVHDGSPDGVGKLSEVQVDEVVEDDSATVDVPQVGDVGASS
jgi:co-chaperonin GroES (HSP10)